VEKASGRLLLNEINTIPGFTSISMYPKLWAGERADAIRSCSRGSSRSGIERHAARARLTTHYGG
jgi:D-alanine-D-alanine ligase